MAFFWESAVLLGVPKSLAAIYAVCFASPEPLSFTDVRERLDISAGSISQYSHGTLTPAGNQVTWSIICIHHPRSLCR